MAVSTIPVVDLSSSDASGRRSIPLVGMGTASYPFAPETTKPAILHAIGLGYRHFDTSSLYETEPALGEAVEEALRLGLIKSRAELFITTKLWCTDAHPDLVLPAIQTSLRNLKLDYLDLYLIHWPMSLKSGARPFPVQIKDILPMDLKAVWEAMEECQRRGLTRSIGVSNFTTKKLEELLQYAKIPPAVNQVEMNPVWQQKKLREFCKERNIHVTSYSPIGGQDGVSGQNPVRDSEVLKGIAKAKGKTVAQVSLRWVYEQGVSIIVKSFNKERLKENLEIFDCELSEEDLCKISQIRQRKKIDVGQIAVLSQESLETIDLSDFSVVE